MNNSKPIIYDEIEQNKEYDSSIELKEIELKINENKSQNNGNDNDNDNDNIKDNKQKKELDRQLFKLKDTDENIFYVSLCIGTISLEIMFIISLYSKYPLYHCSIAAIIFYYPTTIMSILLNCDDNITIKKRWCILIPLNIIFLIILITFGLTNIIKFSTYITFIGLLSPSIIIIILFIYYSQINDNIGYKEKLQYLWDIKSLIIPVFVHFADIATDVGASVEYYTLANKNNQKS